MSTIKTTKQCVKSVLNEARSFLDTTGNIIRSIEIFEKSTEIL